MTQRKQFLITILIIFAVLAVLSVHFLFFLEKSLNNPSSYDVLTAYRLNALIIRFRTFDSIIAGTSMSQNFKCTDLDKITDGFSYKLTASGCKIPQTCRIIDFACKKQKIHTVLMDLHTVLLMNPPPDEQSGYARYYNENSLLGDLCDGITLWSLKDREKYYKRSRSGKNASDWSRDDMYSWSSRFPCSREAIAYDILSGNYTKTENYAPEPEFLPVNIHDYLIPLFRNHPDVTFYLFLPPFTPFASVVGLHYMRDARTAVMDNFLTIPNVRLYDFQGEPSVCLNYDKYRDVQHYSAEVSDWIMEQIKADNYRVTPENRHIFEKRFDDMMNAFDMEKEVEAMKEYSREHPFKM